MKKCPAAFLFYHRAVNAAGSNRKTFPAENGLSDGIAGDRIVCHILAAVKPSVNCNDRDAAFKNDRKLPERNLIALVAERHAKGQPILIGTASVAKSEILSKLLKKAGVKHEVLNAKNHAREAAIIALAGRKGAAGEVARQDYTSPYGYVME